LRKTGLYPHINEELGRAIDELTAQGWHELSKAHCPRLPTAIWDQYKLANGEEVKMADGADSFNLVTAIIKTSPNLIGLITTPNRINVGGFRSLWRSQSILTNTINRLSATLLDANQFMYTGLICSPDKAPTNIIHGCRQVRMFVEYLLGYKDIGITGGIISLAFWNEQYPSGVGHAIAFARCEHDFHFFNWGKKITGTELSTASDVDIAKHITGAPGTLFHINSILFVWEKIHCSRRDWLDPDVSLLTPTQTDELRKIMKVLYSSDPWPGGRTNWVKTFDEGQTKLVEWYLNNASPHHTRNINQYVTGSWNQHQQATNVNHKPTAEQKAMVEEIHKYALANKWEEDQIDWEGILDRSKNLDKTKAERGHFASIRQKHYAHTSQVGEPKDLVSWLVSALTQQELETLIENSNGNREEGGSWRRLVKLYREKHRDARAKPTYGGGYATINDRTL